MPINFSKTFRISEGQRHHYVFDHLFIDYDEAVEFCIQNNIPQEFIVTTKYYVQ